MLLVCVCVCVWKWVSECVGVKALRSIRMNIRNQIAWTRISNRVKTHMLQHTHTQAHAYTISPSQGKVIKVFHFNGSLTLFYEIYISFPSICVHRIPPFANSLRISSMILFCSLLFLSWAVVVVVLITHSPNGLEFMYIKRSIDAYEISSSSLLFTWNCWIHVFAIIRIDAGEKDTQNEF